ncbi:hypothetical protein C5B95_06340 [Rathayibacter sp. AY1A7]|nr:hypothetical protein C5B95_06340 [Rathayibacter sp. AY1A7]
MPPGLVTPRYATQRDYGRATYGGHYAAVSAALGQPLVPWQRYVADVLGEIDEHGRRVYSLGVVTVPRQSGKTTLMQSIQLAQAQTGTGRRGWFTAQTGQDANDRFRETIEAFKAAPMLSRLGTPRLSNGSMSITFANGSTVRPHPPTAKAMHGKQTDDHDSDEVWAWSMLQGTEVRQAVTPTMQNRLMLTGQRPQRRYWSTEGTVESTFFSPLLDGLREDCPPNVALFDFGIGPDVDPFDLEAVARVHPGYGHLFGMSDLEAAAEEFKDSPGEMARAYGNRRTGATERLIPDAAMRDAAWTADFPAGAGRVCLGAAVGVDGVDTTITVSVRVNPELVVTRVIRDGYRDGTHWALPVLKEATAKGDPVVVDKRGPSAALHDACKRADIPMVDIDGGGVATSHHNLYEGLTGKPPRWRYVPHAALVTAAELATKKWWSDGAWIIGRRASVGSVSALEAGALSSWGVDHLPEQYGRQLF